MRYKRSAFAPQDSAIMSLKAGYVYPALVKEMYPNENIQISWQALLRAAPMIFPLYSPVKLRFDVFFNPNRNVWRGDESKDFSTFITGSVNGKAVENTDDLPEHPYIIVPEGGFPAGSLGDFLGFPCNENLNGAKLDGAKVSALRFRHYNDIMRTFYLDENFSTMPEISRAAGLDTTTNLNLLKRCWNKDRFTTATLQPQKGLSVGIPISGDIPVVGNGQSLGFTNGTNDGSILQGTNSNIYGTSYNSVLGSSGSASGPMNNVTRLGISTDPAKSGLMADTSAVDPIAIDTLHLITQIERLNQRDNMWGSRDFECIRTHFGNVINDTRLQRPIHLGWSEVDVNFSEVLQTSQTTTGAGASAQGTITGHSLAVDASHPVRFYCQEWGFLFVMVNVQPIAQYQQGLPRDALYKTRYDYMWPLLSETGEQELYAAEVYGTEANVTSRKIFGFEPRYNHLRFGEKTVHGDFKTNLSSYHAGRIFTSEPNLGENFITSDPTNRMFGVELNTVDPWWLRIEFNIKHVRRLPKWPTPSAIGKLF